MQDSARRSRLALDATVFVSVHALLLAIALFALSLWRLGDRPLLSAGSASLGWLVSLAVGLLALTVIVWRYRRSRRERSRAFVFTLALTLFSALLAVLAAEVGVRVLSTREGDVAVFLGTRLSPRRWSQVVDRCRGIFERSAREPSYLVFDPDLGWAPGKSRQSENGLYFSSTEGIRSPRSGVSLIESREPGAEVVRVALVGDSYTFCEDVTYEGSWGYQLGQRLGPGHHVLNFGVPGYGVDQAVLRYSKDVNVWDPDVVILGFIGHDLYRSLTVYNFIAFPNWELPVSKPRYVFAGEELTLLNRPALAPEAIFSKPAITDLPFLEYEIAFAPGDWRFSASHHSYLWRYVSSRFEPWEDPAEIPPSLSEIEVNRGVLREFVRLARSHDTRPILVFFPSTRSLASHAVTPIDDLEPGQRLLRQVADETGAVRIDLTERLRRVPISDLMSEKHHGTHYSPPTNAVVAQQLEALIRGIAPR